MEIGLMGSPIPGMDFAWALAIRYFSLLLLLLSQPRIVA
jgi:hypothetical protein